MFVLYFACENWRTLIIALFVHTYFSDRQEHLLTFQVDKAFILLLRRVHS